MTQNALAHSREGDRLDVVQAFQGSALSVNTGASCLDKGRLLLTP